MAKAEKYSKSTAEAIKQIMENGKEKPADQVISELENYKNEEGLSLREKGLRETYANRYIEALSRELDIEDQIITGGDTAEGIKASAEVRQIFENVGSFSNEQLIQTEVTPNGLEESKALIDAAIYSLEHSKDYNPVGNEYTAKLEAIKENRISLIEELLRSVHGWNSSSQFVPNLFQQLVESVTVDGKNDFVFHFRCGLSMSGAISGASNTERTER